MTPTLRPLFRAVVTCSLLALAGCATGVAGARHPAEALSLPFLTEAEGAGWVAAHADEAGGAAVVEFVRPPETVDDWTEMVTTQIFRGAVDLVTAEKQLGLYREDVSGRCPGSAVTLVERLPDGVAFDASIVNCDQGADESVVGRFLDGAEDRYVVLYAVRAPEVMTAERRDEWLGELRDVSVATFAPSTR